MTILGITRPEVKPTPKTARPNHPFGGGTFPARRERRMPYTAADLEWAAVNLNVNATDVAPDYDGMAWDAAAQARLDRGHFL